VSRSGRSRCFCSLRLGYAKRFQTPFAHEIWRCLARLKAAGQSILLIDKHIDALLGLAGRHYILEKGRVAWQAPPMRWQPGPSCARPISGCEDRPLELDRAA